MLRRGILLKAKNKNKNKRKEEKYGRRQQINDYNKNIIKRRRRKKNTQ